MKLWGGRFTKETDQLVQNFNESLSFDQKFYRQDIRGSIAHVKMLAKQGQRRYYKGTGRDPAGSGRGHFDHSGWFRL